MRNVNMMLIWLLCALALSGCATPDVPPAPPSVIEGPKLRLAAPPDSVMEPRQADFRKRLLDFFCSSCTTPIATPGSSPTPSK